MTNFDEVLSKSIKEGFRTAIVYAIGAVILGFIFELTAKMVFGFGNVSGNMHVWSLGGFEIATVVRVLICISLIGPFILYMRSKMESLNKFHILLIIFAVAPIIFGIIPGLLTEGSISVKGNYVIATMMAGGTLFNEKIGDKYFKYLLLTIFAIFVIDNMILSDLDDWMKSLENISRHLRQDDAFSDTGLLAFFVPEAAKICLFAYVFLLTPQRIVRTTILK